MSAQLGRSKILVVDDSEIVLEVVRGALEAAGHEVTTHNRPHACVALVLREKPDLILIDVNMPGLGGDTVATILSKTQASHDSIVLLHSSMAVDTLREKAKASGAHGFIQKTSDMFVMVREVHRWLRQGVRTSSARLAAARDVSAPMAYAPSSSTLRVAPALAEAPASAPRLPASGTLSVEPTLLLVDDDMEVLSGFRRLLARAGLHIEFALSGSAALRRITSDRPPDVVVSDMLLPDLNGAELYRRAVEHDPRFSQRFVVVTGARAVPEVSEFLREFPGPVVHKPAGLEELIAAIQRCLPERPGIARAEAGRGG